MRKTFLLIFIFICSNILPQNLDYEEIYYTYIEIAKSIGDLNNDGINDSVVVTQDTTEQNKPYLLEVFFADENNNHELIVSSKKVVLPEYRETSNDLDASRKFSDIYIDDGCLFISHSQLRGHFEHKFKYIGKNMTLYGYSEINSDGMGHLISSYFNLETGELVVRQERFTTGQIINLERDYKRIAPIPTLQDFEPLSNEFF